MGRFLSGLSWSQPVASKAHTLGMGLDDVQALVESRDAQVEHPRLHHYAYSQDGVRVLLGLVLRWVRYRKMCMT